MLGGEESCQGMQGGEPGITRGDAVATLFLQAGQELSDALGAEIVDLQTFEAASGVPRDETQEEHDGIPIASDRMGAHPSLVGQVVLEEAHERAPEVVLVDGCHHATPPETKLPKDASKRSLAACASSGIQRR